MASERARTVTADCPSCKTKTLDVIVGRKSTERTIRCPLCKNVYSYSAWVLKTTENGSTFHQVDLIKLS